MLDGKRPARNPRSTGPRRTIPKTRKPAPRGQGPLVSRRNFIATCLAGASAMLLWPRAAKADGYDVGGGWFGSAGNWAILKHGDGNWIGSKSGWFSWVCGHSQWIGVAAGLWVEAQYSNELYDAFHMQPPRRLPGLERPEQASPVVLVRPRHAPAVLVRRGMTEDHGWALTNEILGEGYGGWWATGLRNFGYEGKDFFFRRQRETSSHGFGLSAGFYNVCVGEYAGGSWDDWEHCYVWIHTNGGYSCADWNYQGAAFENEGGACPGDIKAGQDRCRLEQMGPVRRGVEGHQRLRERKRAVPRRLRRRDVVGNVPLVLGLLRGDLPGLVRQRRRRRLDRQGAHAQPLPRAQSPCSDWASRPA